MRKESFKNHAMSGNAGLVALQPEKQQRRDKENIIQHGAIFVCDSDSGSDGEQFPPRGAKRANCDMGGTLSVSGGEGGDTLGKLALPVRLDGERCAGYEPPVARGHVVDLRDSEDDDAVWQHSRAKPCSKLHEPRLREVSKQSWQGSGNSGGVHAHVSTNGSTGGVGGCARMRQGDGEGKEDSGGGETSCPVSLPKIEHPFERLQPESLSSSFSEGLAAKLAALKSARKRTSLYCRCNEGVAHSGSVMMCGTCRKARDRGPGNPLLIEFGQPAQSLRGISPTSVEAQVSRAFAIFGATGDASVPTHSVSSASLLATARYCFLSMVRREQEFSDHVVFYHKYNASSLLYEVQAELVRTLLSLPNDTAPLCRLLQSPFKKIPHMDYLLKLFPGLLLQDCDPDYQAVAICATVSLFGGNSEAPPLSTFAAGYCANTGVLYRVLSSLLTELGASKVR